MELTSIYLEKLSRLRKKDSDSAVQRTLRMIQEDMESSLTPYLGRPHDAQTVNDIYQTVARRMAEEMDRRMLQELQRHSSIQFQLDINEDRDGDFERTYGLPSIPSNPNLVYRG